MDCLSYEPKAKQIGVDDIGSYYTGTNVETALQEIGVGTTLDSRYWTLIGDQSSISGTKSGSFNLTSTGTGTLGYVRLGTAGANAPFIFPFSGTAYSVPVAGGTSLAFYSYVATGSAYAMAFPGETVVSTSGLFSNFVTPRGFAPASGNCNFNAFHIIPTINQTGGADGVTRGLYVAPILTSAADWRSIETSNNTGYAFYGAGTAPSYFGGNLTTTSALSATSINIVAYENEIVFSNNDIVFS